MGLNIAFAGDRQISVDILSYLISNGIIPKILIIPDLNKSSHGHKLKEICSKFPEIKILEGESFKENNGMKFLKEAELDYIISIHFHAIYPGELLSIPKKGIINLHPAYLPYNRGWHTPTWAIIDDTPYGATLHFMNETVDTGDIIHRKKLEIFPDDTADTLYKRVLELEYDVFVEAWPKISENTYSLIKQSIDEGTSHKKKDLESIREIELEKNVQAKELINKFRALTTNKKEERAYFYEDGEKYYIQIEISREKK